MSLDPQDKALVKLVLLREDFDSLLRAIRSRQQDLLAKIEQKLRDSHLTQN